MSTELLNKYINKNNNYIAITTFVFIVRLLMGASDTAMLHTSEDRHKQCHMITVNSMMQLFDFITTAAF